MKIIDSLLDNITPRDDGVYNDLDWFIHHSDQIGALNPYLIEKLRPFRKGNYRNYYHFRTQNEALIRLLKGLEINSSTGEVSLKDEVNESKFLEYFGNDYGNKLKRLFQKLNDSGILCIQLENYESDDNHNRIQIPQTETCNCKRCLWDRFEIKKLLKEIDSTEPYHLYKEKESISETLAGQAYINYLIGRMRPAYYWLKQITERADEKHSVQEVLAEHNMLLMKPSIESLPPSQKDDILPEIENIDIYSTISGFSPDSLERDFLVEVFQQKLLFKTDWTLDYQLNEIRDTRDIFEGKGERISADHTKLLEEAFTLNYMFYHGNNLFDINQNRYKRTVKKLWEGLFLSYTTVEAYKYRLTHFSWFHIREAIRNLGPKELRELFGSFEIKSLEMKEEEYVSLIDCATNFFSSNHISKEKVIFGQNPVAESTFTSELNSNYRFDWKIESFSQNFLFFLAYASIPEGNEEKFRNLTDTIHDYFEVELKTTKHFTFDSLSAFLKEKVALFSEKQIERHICILLSHPLPSGSIFKETISQVKEVLPSFIIKSEKVWSLIKDLFHKKSGRRLELIDLTPLIRLFPPKSQWAKDFYSEIEKELEKFGKEKYWNTFFIRELVDSALIEPKNQDWFQSFMTYCNEVLEEKYFNSQVRITNEGCDIVSSTIPYNIAWNMVYLIRKFDLKEEDYVKYLDIPALPEVLQWILSPQTFDDKAFDPRWLYFFNDSIFYSSVVISEEQMKKIEMFLSANFQSELAKIYYEAVLHTQ